jgi:hypothetical protein
MLQSDNGRDEVRNSSCKRLIQKLEKISHISRYLVHVPQPICLVEKLNTELQNCALHCSWSQKCIPEDMWWGPASYPSAFQLFPCLLASPAWCRRGWWEYLDSDVAPQGTTVHNVKQIMKCTQSIPILACFMFSACLKNHIIEAKSVLDIKYALHFSLELPFKTSLSFSLIYSASYARGSAPRNAYKMPTTGVWF